MSDEKIIAKCEAMKARISRLSDELETDFEDADRQARDIEAAADELESYADSVSQEACQVQTDISDLKETFERLTQKIDEAIVRGHSLHKGGQDGHAWAMVLSVLSEDFDEIEARIKEKDEQEGEE